MRSFAFCVAFLAVLTAAPATAQQPSPVAQHYRAYRAALERGDLAQAETEAAAALEASPTRDASTAALALNLAIVRLNRGERAQALSPAQLAASLAGASQGRVDPLVADIALKRASLASGDQSAADLSSVLAAAQAHRGLDEYVYDGAADLGGWAIEQHQSELALRAWRMAVQASPGDDDAANLSRARALVGEGAAALAIDIAAAAPSAPTSSRSTVLSESHRGAGHVPTLDALRALAEAVNLLRPLALRAAPDGAMTAAQLEYAHAAMFETAVEVRVASFNVDMSSLDLPGSSWIALPAHAGDTPCIPHIIAQPMPHFPSDAANQGNVGAVMTRLVITETGNVTDAHVVATAGGAGFTDAINRVIGRWRVERAASSPPGCHMAMTAFVPIRFVLSSDSDFYNVPGQPMGGSGSNDPH
ncbi:MAG: energy transducer TonB [Vitreimonas sp.]